MPGKSTQDRSDFSWSEAETYLTDRATEARSAHHVGFAQGASQHVEFVDEAVEQQPSVTEPCLVVALGHAANRRLASSALRLARTSGSGGVIGVSG